MGGQKNIRVLDLPSQLELGKECPASDHLRVGSQSIFPLVQRGAERQGMAIKLGGRAPSNRSRKLRHGGKRRYRKFSM